MSEVAHIMAYNHSDNDDSSGIRALVLECASVLGRVDYVALEVLYFVLARLDIWISGRRR